jgi:hypothetical protein
LKYFEFGFHESANRSGHGQEGFELETHRLADVAGGCESVEHATSANKCVVSSFAFSISNHLRARPYVILISDLLGPMPAGGRLLQIFESGIWPSSEDTQLYYAMRQRNNDYDSVNRKPGHLFSRHERERFESFLGMALDFGWGGSIVGGGDAVTVAFNYDGKVMLLCHELQPRIAERLSQSGIPYTSN